MKLLHRFIFTSLGQFCHNNLISGQMGSAKCAISAMMMIAIDRCLDLLIETGCVHRLFGLKIVLDSINIINVNANPKVFIYSLISPLSSADFTIYTPCWYWNSLLFSLISSGGNSAIANIYNLAFSFHQVPVTVGWTGI